MGYLEKMVVIHRAHGFRFVIYTLDHEPAHVHVVGPGQAKINLLGSDGMAEVVWSVGVKRSDMRRLIAEIVARRDTFWNGSASMVGSNERQLKAAEARGRKMYDTEPRASAAHYDRVSGRVVVDLVNGCSYAFPPQLVQDLRDAGADDLAGVEVDGLGFNLHWPALEVDLFVPALVSGIFGTRAWMSSELARVAGRKRSPAKAAAARANGAKGGRPRKAANG